MSLVEYFFLPFIFSLNISSAQKSAKYDLKYNGRQFNKVNIVTQLVRFVSIKLANEWPDRPQSAYYVRVGSVLNSQSPLLEKPERVKK